MKDWDSITAEKQELIDDHIVKVNKLVEAGNNLITHLARYEMLTSMETAEQKLKEGKLRNEWRKAVECSKS